MKNLIVGMVLLAAIIFGTIWLIVDKSVRDKAFGFFRDRDPGKTPEETLERFGTALDKRDFIWAANCCTGKFAEETMKKNAEDAQQLAEGIDSLVEVLEYRNLDKKDFYKLLIYQTYPFPDSCKKAGDVEVKGEEAFVDVKYIDRLSKLETPSRVKLKKEGEFWKIEYENPSDIPSSVPFPLYKNLKELKQVIKKNRDDIRHGREDTATSHAMLLEADFNKLIPRQ
jgi:hypothetical protein